MSEIENVVIIGSGPAGHTAAIYAGRALLKPLMFEGEMAGGVAAGGQLTTTTDVENYPGFPEGVMGPELMMKFREQSQKCDTRIVTKTVDSVDLSQQPFKVQVGQNTIQTKTVIIATGAIAKRLGLPGEEKLWQKGISACAVCDGGLPIFRNKALAVIGGGDSACEEADYLSKFASIVYLLVRKDVFRASKVMQKRVENNEKINIMFHTTATEVLGENLVSGLKIKNLETNEESELEIGGLFYAVGHTPNTSFLDGQIELDENGYIKTVPGSARTSVEGVFAAGDVQDHVYRQAVTSAGTGCMAALDAEKFIAESE